MGNVASVLNQVAAIDIEISLPIMFASDLAGKTLACNASFI